MRLYGHPISGNTHRVELFLSVLGVDYEYVRVDLREGQHKTPVFRQLNPLAQVPVLEDDGLILRDSTAILVYLARKFDAGNRWLPADPVGQARVQQWLSTAVNEIQAGPFVLRLVKLTGAALDYESARRTTERLFDDLFEPHLARRRWLAGKQATIADLACYGYVAGVIEGDFSLDPYPAIRGWLGRVEAIDGFVPMLLPAAEPL